MNLDKLKLENILLQLGDEILIKVIGKQRIKTLSKLTNKSINSIMMVELLKKRLGNQIFSDSILRGNIIFSLKEEYKSYLFYGDESKTIDQEDLKKMINASWDRRFNYFKSLIEIFDLDESYLPEIPYHREQDIIVESKNQNSSDNLNFFQKILRKIKLIFQKIFRFFFNKKELSNNSNLFDFQNRVKNKILKAISNNIKRMIIHMPTGSGKTRTTISSIIDLMNNKNNYTAVWLAHTDELCEQAIETFTNLWSLEGKGILKISRLDKNLKLEFNNNKNLIVSTYQKLSSMRTGSEEKIRILESLRRNLSIIIADEAHMLPAETFNDSINFLDSVSGTFIIGLSATPGRGVIEKQNQQLANFFNKFKITITNEEDKELEDPIRYLQERKILANIKAFNIATNFNFELSDDQKLNILNNFQINDLIIKQMEKDEERNLCIISHLIDLVNKGKSTIVFACSLEHSKLLNEVCILLDIKCASIDDKTSFNSRKKFIEDFKNKKIDIIFNYGVLSTGFDAPNTNAIMIARPTASPIMYSQMLGRGLRGSEVNGNDECWLIDLKDNLKGLPDERNCFTLYNQYYNKIENYNLN